MILSIDRHVDGSTVRLVLRGEIDLGTRWQLIDEIDAALGHTGMMSLEIDLSAVAFMDCCGLGALIHGRAVSDAMSRRFVITGASGMPLIVMRAAGLVDLCTARTRWDDASG